jgi:AraC-like DNA-binding protein
VDVIQGGADRLLELRDLVVELAQGRPRVAVLDGVNVGVMAHPTEPAGTFTVPSLTVVAQGVKRTELNGRSYEYRAGQYLVVSLALPVVGGVLHATAAEPFAALSVALDRTVIADLLATAPVRASSAELAGMAVSDVEPDLLDPVLRLLRLAKSPADLAVLGAGVRREVLWRLLRGGQGALVRQIGLADGRLASVARVARFIRDHYGEPLSIAELAEQAGMSTASLHRHFRAATSMTPLQYQKAIRLQEARALIIADGGEIAEVGYLVGYESPSQFSREYRRRFGDSPRNDRHRARHVPAG